MIDHELKTWPSYFAAIREGRKTFEVRVADRDYQVGDTLILREWDPDKQRMHDRDEQTHYTGRELRARVTYLLHIGAFTAYKPLVVMSIYVEPDQGQPGA